MLSIAELEPGIPENLVLDRANAEGALLLTADKDFGELITAITGFRAGWC